MAISAAMSADVVTAPSSVFAHLGSRPNNEAIVMQNLLSVKDKLVQLLDSSLDDVVALVEAQAKHYHDGHYTVMSFTTGVKAMFGTVDLDTGDGRESVNKLTSYPDMHMALSYLLAKDKYYVVGV